MPANEKSFLRRLDQNFEKPFLVAGLILMIFIITYQTLYRYSISQTFSILNNPSFAAWIGQYIAVDTLRQKLDGLTGMAVWSEELARYIFIWISYLLQIKSPGSLVFCLFVFVLFFVCLVGWFFETGFLCVTLAVLELTV